MPADPGVFTYGSVCSGIEAASVAWHPLGWRPAFFAEVDPFASAVLAHRWPGVENLGDFTAIGEERAPVALLVGGTPCQSFSVAGKRLGLDDPRGNLAIEFLRLARRLRPRWLVWENVPGVLSSGGGRDFGAFLGLLGELGYGWAYRVLDAVHFGVPQRRRRVFVVGHLGDWRRAVAVLFERDCLSGNPPPGREAGPRLASSVTASSGRRNGQPGNWGEVRNNLISDAPVARESTSHGGRLDGDSETFIVKGAAIGREPENGPQYGEVLSDGTCYTLNCTERHGGLHAAPETAHTLRVDGFDASEDGTGRGTPLIPVAFDSYNHATADVMQTVGAEPRATNRPMVAYECHVMNMQGGKGQAGWSDNLSPTLGADTQSHAVSSATSAVRRLTPRECERLQAFPDDYTLIPYRGKPTPDGPRYKAIGNSMAVPVMAWIGRRIAEVDSLPSSQPESRTHAG